MAEVVQIYNSEILYIVLYTGCSNKIKPSDEFLIRWNHETVFIKSYFARNIIKNNNTPIMPEFAKGGLHILYAETWQDIKNLIEFIQN